MKGSIRKIYLKNFMTYNEASLEPGPHLNLVLGPNGTGKSALMCAMCLGLAGDKTTIGRAPRDAEYIKHTRESATIEITLDDGRGGVIVINRVISHTKTANKYMINGKVSTREHVEATVKDMNIQINNLCQFLPQEKVSDFAKMSPIELLDNTEKAVGDSEMIDAHQHLKNSRIDIVKKVQEKRSLVDRLGEEKKKNERMTEDVKNFEERQKLLDTIAAIQCKIPWVVYDKKREEHFNAKTIANEKDRQLKEVEKELAPLKKQIDKLKADETKIEKDLKHKEEQIVKNNTKYSNTLDLVDKEADKIKDIQDNFNLKVTQEAQHKKSIQEDQQKVAAMQEELESMPVQGNVQPEIARVHQEMVEVKQNMTQFENVGQSIQLEVNEFQRAIRENENNLTDLQSTSQRRLASLRQRHKDTYDAVIWLRENKSKFTDTIHEPMFLTLNATELHYAKYIEAHIPWNDMRAFITENPEDAELFIRLVKTGKNLKVNIVNVPQYKVFKPKTPINDLRKFGFTNYMREVMQCHPAVMLYICTLHRVHEVPIGDSSTYNHIETITKKFPDMRRFFTEDIQFDIRRSRYSNETSTKSTQLNEASYLNISVDFGKIRVIQDDIRNMKRDQKVKTDEYQQLQAQSKEVEARLNELRNEKRNLIKSKEARGVLMARIQNMKASISRKQQDVTDLDGERERVNERIGQVMLKKASLLRRHYEIMKSTVDMGHEKVRVFLDLLNVCGEQSFLEKKSELQIQTLNSLEDEVGKLKAVVTSTKADAKYLLEKAQEATGPEDLMTDERREFLSKLPKTVEELEALIDEYRLKADSAFHADEKDIRAYYMRVENIKSMERQLLKSHNEIEKHQERLNVAREQWLNPLNDLISRINENFSMFFSFMKCAGEVVLSVPDDKEDYAKYGIKIRVKFRDSESLKDLNSQTQSGGERSVATVMYMMALQEITVCPFRCVDEINQGMDPTNERRVFDVIFKTVCERNSSQYFLLTPKLLTGLEYPENINVIFIFNGEEQNLSPGLQDSLERLIGVV